MRRRRTLLAAAALTLALAGCASADKNAADTSSSMSGMSMSGSSSSAGSASSNSGSSVGSAVGSSGSAMGSMSSMKTTTVIENGVPTPVPIKTIGTADWKDMEIQAQEMTPVPFYIDNGTSSREVKPAKNTSFHLMVMLTDRHTGVALPYANVWAVITKHGKTVFNERQWPMLSEYMGPHYGNNVALPGPGTYKLTLLVSAPAAAMHIEYANMWSGTHKVTTTFTWK